MNEDPTLYCTFRSAGRLFGVPILDVKEVTTETICTRIPHAPKEVVGFVNIRGHIFLALDLRRLLSLDGETNAVNRRLVIFKLSVGPAFGVIVDEIGAIVTVSTTQMEEASSVDREFARGDRAELVAKVGKLPQELLVVLEPRRFLPIVERALSAA
jgi:purine-binding chemotaxis protein CheW